MSYSSSTIKLQSKLNYTTINHSWSHEQYNIFNIFTVLINLTKLCVCYVVYASTRVHRLLIFYISNWCFSYCLVILFPDYPLPCLYFQYPEHYPEEEPYLRPREPFREGEGRRFPPPPPWMRPEFDDFPERRPFPPPPPDRMLREHWGPRDLPPRDLPPRDLPPRDLPPRGPWREFDRFGDPYDDPYLFERERDRYVYCVVGQFNLYLHCPCQNNQEFT